MKKWSRSDSRETGHPWKEEGSVHGLANKIGGLIGVMTESHLLNALLNRHKLGVRKGRKWSDLRRKDLTKFS